MPPMSDLEVDARERFLRSVFAVVPEAKREGPQGAALRARMEARTNRTRVKTICGLTVIEQAPDLDSRILLPADRDPGSAIRKIEPQICTADSSR